MGKGSLMNQDLEHQLADLKQRLVEINDLRSVGAVLVWDQATPDWLMNLMVYRG